MSTTELRASNDEPIATDSPAPGPFERESTLGSAAGDAAASAHSLASAHSRVASRPRFGAGEPSTDDVQSNIDSHPRCGVVGHQLGESKEGSITDPVLRRLPDTSPPVVQCLRDSQSSPGDGWLLLRMWSETYFDAMQHRVAAGNRAGRFSEKQRVTVDADTVDAYLAPLIEAENIARLQMLKQYRKVVPPAVKAWQKESLGVGEHLVARLLGCIGHPIIAVPHWWEGEGTKRTLMRGEPFERTPRQLWAYCGRGDPARRARKGMDAEDAASLGNPRAKMVIHLLAEGCLKEPGRKVELLKLGEQHPDECRWRYRSVYERARIEYWTNPRDDWSDGHQHNSALRLVAKEILRDLWIAARED